NAAHNEFDEIGRSCNFTEMAALGEVGVQTLLPAPCAPESIRERILPEVVSGDCILAVCMTEPHAGPDVTNYRTNAVIKGNGVILNGTRTLISRAREAGMIVTLTRIERPARCRCGVICREDARRRAGIVPTLTAGAGSPIFSHHAEAFMRPSVVRPVFGPQACRPHRPAPGSPASRLGRDARRRA